MPELPEVETVRRGLALAINGGHIESVAVHGRRSIRRQSDESFRAALAGCRVEAVLRHGKYLYVQLDNGASWVTHLRMSGKLTFVAKNDAYEPHTHVVIAMRGDKELRFVDPRTFGEMFATDDFDENGLPMAFAKMGVDAYCGEYDGTTLAGLAKKRTVALKAFLLDQNAICGIGSIYADEICFRAHLRPERSVATLKKRDFVALAMAIKGVISDAVELRGSSLKDASYRDLFGELGSYQAHHAVYGRFDEPCVTCGTQVRRLRVAGRSAHFCPKCQR